MHSQDWKRPFVGAVIELGWSSAAMVIATHAPVHATQFLANRESLEALIEYLDCAPVAEQSLLRKSVVFGERTHAALPLPVWRQRLKGFLWQCLVERMIVSTATREYEQVGRAAELLVLIPAPSAQHLYSWRRAVVLIAGMVGARERNTAGMEAFATDIHLPAAAAIEAVDGGDVWASSGVMSDLAAAVEGSGLHDHETPFVIRVALRRAWWPSWRQMGWLWMSRPRVMPLLTEMKTAPAGKWPPGAREHLSALLSRHAFPTLPGETTAWDDV